MRELLRAGKWITIGTSTFILDMLMLYTLVEFFHMWEVAAAALSFTVAVSINYTFSRRHVFFESERGMVSGYVYFVGVAALGLVMVSSLMYLAVDVWHIQYLLARTVIAGLVGAVGYAINYFFNFRMHEV